MDFARFFGTVVKEFGEEGIRYGLIGGLALGLWEVTRATADADFLILREDLEAAENILGRHGYRVVYKSENVVQYAEEGEGGGQVDVLLGFREVTRGMLARRVRKPLGMGLEVDTLLPEDLMGLKLQAMVNQPAREFRELADMAALIEARRRRGETMDWSRLKSYFELFQRLELLRRLQGES